MEIDYTISRAHIYGLEFVRSEMELKVTLALRKNPNFDALDANKKIKAIADAQKYLHVLFEELERIKKDNLELKIVNSKLLAENLMSKK